MSGAETKGYALANGGADCLITPYYDRDGITIYNADCRDVLPTIDAADVALLLTDPPYGIDHDPAYADRMHRGSRVWTDRIHGDDVAFDATHLLTFGRCVIWGANYFAPQLPVGSWLIWRKRGVSPVLAECEMAWHNCGGKRVSFFESAHKRTYTVDGVLHPTQKPAALMRWIVDRYTDPGELVLDPFMGSGPVAQACADLGRRYIGIEIVAAYCNAAVGRLGQQAFNLGGAT